MSGWTERTGDATRSMPRAGGPARVLVVDDSGAIRRMVGEAIANCPDLVVVGSVPNGRVALDQLDELRPDVVTLDMEMPVLDGLGTLRELRQRAPRLPVLVFSSRTERGAIATLDALAAGASDFVTKPNAGGIEGANRFVVDEVIPRIRALGERRTRAAALAAAPSAEARADRGLRPIDAIVIGVSTGGPRALETVIPKLPADLAVPVFVVQHMPPTFTRLLAERLHGLGPLPVSEVTTETTVAPGHVYVAPGGRHMKLVPRATPTLVLDDGPLENGCRPAVDPLFRSAAAIYGGRLLGVVLTGMGRDGCAGAKAIVDRGGAIVAQDAKTSVVWGMPGAVVEAGLATVVLPLEQVAVDLTRRARAGRPGGRS